MSKLTKSEITKYYNDFLDHFGQVYMIERQAIMSNLNEQRLKYESEWYKNKSQVNLWQAVKGNCDAVMNVPSEEILFSSNYKKGTDLHIRLAKNDYSLEKAIRNEND